MAKDKKRPRQTFYPFLRYRKAFDAIEWLAATFGFETEMVVPNEAGGVAHAQLRFGQSLVMLGSVDENDPLGLLPAGERGGATQGIYVVVEDAEEHYRLSREGGAEIIQELTHTDYGSTDYSARDPEGHIWSFGTYHPDDDAEG